MDLPAAAVADLAEDMGRALLRFAARVRSSSLPEEPTAAAAEVAAPPAPAPAVAVVAAAQEAPDLHGLGASQRRVLEAVQAAGDIGMTARQVAEATGLKSTNTPRILKALAERGLISSWGANPVIWHAEAG